MRQIILATHGEMAKGIKHTLEMIIGEDKRVQSLGLMPGHHPDELKQKIETWANEKPDDEFIILCDLFGGSVANSLMHLCTCPNIHVITGVNLGMAITLCTAAEEEPLAQLIRDSLKEAKKYMLYTNDLMEKKGGCL